MPCPSPLPRALALLVLIGCSPRSAMPDARAEPPAEPPAEPVAEPAPTSSDLVDVSAPRTPVAGLTLRTVEHRGRVFDVATLDLRQVTLRLEGPAPGTERATFSELAVRLEQRGERLVWGTNAGIFGKDGRPLGLQIEQGVTRRGLNRGTGYGNFYLAPNGAFLVGPSGARVRTTEELAEEGPGDATVAAQSGPMLCRAGVLHPALNADSANLLLRSGVGVSDAHTVHFAMSRGSVRFHELATLFRDGLHAPDALYLDGVISQWVSPEQPPGPTDGGFGGTFSVAVPRRAPGSPADGPGPQGL